MPPGALNVFSKLNTLCLLSMLCIFSCAPARFVKPLKEGEQAINISCGGPLIKYGNATIPMPFLTAGYAYGLDSSCTGFSELNLTSGFFGNFQIEVGATKQLIRQHNFAPSVSCSPIINLIYRNKSASKLYPQFTLSAFWEYGKRKSSCYVGIDNWFELASKRKYGIKQENHWIFMPMVGHVFTTGKWDFNVEAKVIAPDLSNEKLVIEYQTPLHNSGAFGIYFGCTRKF